MATVSSVISSIKSFLTSKYLALTGGTMTGVIKTSATDFITKTVDTGHLTFVGGTAWNKGGAVRLCGMSESGKEGHFEVIAHNGTNGRTLLGKPDGSLTWNGKSVVCVESGTSGNFWYRKYADGWIEQGGLLVPSSGDDNYLDVVVTLPVSFSNTNYSAIATGSYTKAVGSSASILTKKTTTQVGFNVHIYKSVAYPTFYCCGR